MGNKNSLAIVATVLAILGIVWQAAIQWEELQGRVRILEKSQQFYHGDVPKEAK